MCLFFIHETCLSLRLAWGSQTDLVRGCTPARTCISPESLAFDHPLGRCFVSLRLMEMFHAVTLSARTIGVSCPGVCRYPSAGRASAADLGSGSAGRWYTRFQRGRL